MTNSVAFALSLPAFTRYFQSRAYITIQCISLEPKLPFRHTMSPWGWNGCWGQPPKDYRVHVQLPSAVLFWTYMPCSDHVLHQSFAPILRRQQAASGKRQAAHTRLQTACNMQHTYEKQEAGAACSMSSTIAARGSTARSMQPAALSAQHAARGKRHAASSTHAASGVQPAARHALNGIFATLS